MHVPTRLRWPGIRNASAVALTIGLAIFLAACGQNHPNSIFHRRTEINRDVDHLFQILIWAGTAVFVLVEAILVLTLIRFRRRPGQPEPKHVHGNTTLEITWTVIPLLILIMIAIPTIRTIFKSQTKASANALQVEVIGHQWWWEFRYPQYQIVTANELYLPIGRTVNFTLKTQDVIHSFWVPSLAGKRDVVSNHVNYLWYTPDSTTANVFNGSCAEYCGTSHANMRFKVFTVAAADFESWAKHQQEPAVGSPSGTDTTTRAAPAPVTQAGFLSFPKEQIPGYAVPQTPLPPSLAFNDNLTGDPASGAKLIVGAGGCLACHSIKGNPMMVGVIGPNLTHIASRTTIGAGLYPNDARHLARWIKNAPVMKAGILMPSLGANQYDPVRKMTMRPGLSDQQIADIVAYLQTLK